jgi:hypothetical protein
LEYQIQDDTPEKVTKNCHLSKNEEHTESEEPFEEQTARHDEEKKLEIKPTLQTQASAKSNEELEEEENKRQERLYGKPVPGIDIPDTCPIGKPICVQSHDLCDSWYAGGCNQDFDST